MTLFSKLKLLLTAFLVVVISERRRRLYNDLKGFANHYRMRIFKYLKILVLLIAIAITVYHFLS